MVTGELDLHLPHRTHRRLAAALCRGTRGVRVIGCPLDRCEERDAYRKAVEASGNAGTCLRELGGICLELGDFSEAVEVSTKAVIAEPGGHEIIANQAISFLLADRVPEAAKAIASAVRLSPDDKVNRNIELLIQQVMTGERERPRTLREAKGAGCEEAADEDGADRGKWPTALVEILVTERRSKLRPARVWRRMFGTSA